MRALARFLLVREGEGAVVVHLGLLTLTVGLAMAIGRSSSDALFFKRFGIEYLPQMFFLTSVLLALFSAVYASYADRIRHARMFGIMLGLTATCIALNWLGMRVTSGVWPFVIYYLLFAVASELILVHTGLYASGLLDAGQAKRILPLLSAAMRLGAIMGGMAVGMAGLAVPLEHMAFAWSVFLFFAWFLVSRSRITEPFVIHRRNASALSDIKEGLRFASRSALLRTSGIGLFLMVVLISWQDYIASVILTRHFEDENALAAFFGWFFAATNLAVLILQLTVTNRLLHRFGIKLVSLIFPVTTLLSFALLLVSASFIPALIARFNYTGLLQAFRNPAANLFFVALPAYMQGRARAVNVALILPLGLAAAGLSLLAVKQVGLPALAFVGAIGSVVYIVAKLRKHRSYRQALIGLVQQQVFSHRDDDLMQFGHIDEQVMEQILGELVNGDDGPALEFASDLFLRAAPEHAGPRVLALLGRMATPVRDRVLRRLAAEHIPGWVEYAQACLEHSDAHMQATALRLLACAGSDVDRYIEAWLTGGAPRLRAAAAGVALSRDSRLSAAGREAIVTMLNSVDARAILSALDVADALSEAEPLLERLLGHADPAIRAHALVAYCHSASARGCDCAQFVMRALDDSATEVRTAALMAGVALGSTTTRLGLLARSLSDPSGSVRRAAAEGAARLMPQTIEDFDGQLCAWRNDFEMHAVLCECLDRSSFAARDELLYREAAEHVRRAKLKRSARSRLATQAHSPELELALLALQEEAARHVDATLAILQALGEREAMAAVRAALASGNRKLRAQAMESLSLLRHRSVIKDLLPVLDETDLRPDSARHGAASELEDIANTCVPVSSAWLRECLAQADAALERA